MWILAVLWLIVLQPLSASAADCGITGSEARPPLEVAAHGAVPDDGKDDSAALAAAIAAAGPDRTLIFSPGIYRVSKTVALASQQTYLGRPGARLVWTGPGADFVFSAHATKGVRIACLVFERGGLKFDGFTQDVEIIGNRFEAIFDPGASFGHESAIYVAGLTDQARIDGNRFSQIGLRVRMPGSGHGNAILAYHLNNAEIAENHFENVHQAISLIFEGRPGSGIGISVRGNRVRNAHRMGIEAFGKGTHGAVFEQNVVAKRLGDDARENIGLSIVINEGFETLVRDNRVESLTRPDGRCSGMGIEAAGIATRVAGNTVLGHWCSAIAVHADHAQYSLVEDNLVCGHQGPYAAINFYHGEGRSQARRNRVETKCLDRPEKSRKNAHNHELKLTAPGR